MEIDNLTMSHYKNKWCLALLCQWQKPYLYKFTDHQVSIPRECPGHIPGHSHHPQCTYLQLPPQMSGVNNDIQRRHAYCLTWFIASVGLSHHRSIDVTGAQTWSISIWVNCTLGNRDERSALQYQGFHTLIFFRVSPLFFSPSQDSRDKSLHWFFFADFQQFSYCAKK